MPEHQQIQQSKKPDTIFQKQFTPVSQTPLSNPTSIIQRAKINPKSLSHADVMHLQRTIGNRAVGRLLSGIGSFSTVQQAPVQRQEIPEEEESLQGKFESKLKQAACTSCSVAPTLQRQEIPEEEEPLQGKLIKAIQRQEIPEVEEPLRIRRENNTGMPANLKAGVESLSGIDMSDVRVHYNSSKPVQVGALAYTQGANIHVAPGQERHLPHESWHVVQQVQGRVQPTMQLKGLAVNDDAGLEREADDFGDKLINGGNGGTTDHKNEMNGVPGALRYIEGSEVTYKKGNLSGGTSFSLNLLTGSKVAQFCRHGPGSDSDSDSDSDYEDEESSAPRGYMKPSSYRDSSIRGSDHTDLEDEVWVAKVQGRPALWWRNPAQQVDEFVLQGSRGRDITSLGGDDGGNTWHHCADHRSSGGTYGKCTMQQVDSNQHSSWGHIGGARLAGYTEDG